MSTNELKPVAWMDDGSLRAGSHGVAFRVVTDETKRDMPNAAAVSFATPLYSADAIERLERERDELRREVMGGEPDYANFPSLSHGNFIEMARSLHAACHGGRTRDEAAESELATLRARVAKMEEALGDLLSWFPDCPSEPEWRLKAGRYGADDALAHARSLLTEEPAS